MTLEPAAAAPRALLLQIRRDAQVQAEEYASFLAHGGLQAHQLATLDAFATPRFGPEVLEGFSALFVGGASDASVLEPQRYPFVPAGIELLRHCIRTDIPVFASCFGFQLAVLALNGEIVRDHADYEMGTPSIRLTAAARSDPLFHDMPDPFPAVSVHKERAPALPEGCELLAYTSACPHAFRVTGKPFWAFQFHPEVDRATLVERLTHFRAQYTDGDDHLQQVLDQAVPTPDSNALTGKFVARVLHAGA
ncbi:MAG: type 1 glutamine amidotransferase [Gammaproteobacteria bacterium]|jgi:GMP synthase (glutamine-hydrolysing)|nr:type 1 glutamine amidotransferase [Gammaproteobacteria bacterium]